MVKNKLKYGLVGILSAVSISSCADYAELVMPAKECPGVVEAADGHNNFYDSKRINVIIALVNYFPEDVADKVKKTLSFDGEGQGLFAIEPYHSNKEAFNLWYYPHPVQVDDYEKSGFGFEALGAVRVLNNNCEFPNKAVIALVNWEFQSNAEHHSFMHYLDIMKMNTAQIGEFQLKYNYLEQAACRHIVKNICKKGRDAELCKDIEELRGQQSPDLDEEICNIVAGGSINFSTMLVSEYSKEYVIGHEAGHAIVGFWDEYVSTKKYDTIIDKNSYLQELRDAPVNCFAGTKQECEESSPWAGMIGINRDAGCFRGCAYTTEVLGIPIWRSVENGLMTNHAVREMGGWDEAVACRALHIATQKARGICEKFGF